MRRAVDLVIGYALRGNTWMIMKTGDSLQSRATRFARALSLAMIAAIGVVSSLTIAMRMIRPIGTDSPRSLRSRRSHRVRISAADNFFVRTSFLASLRWHKSLSGRA